MPSFTYFSTIEYFDGITFKKFDKQDPFSKGHTKMIKYYNLLYARERGIHFRKRFNLMNILGEIGGIKTVLGSFFALMLSPLYYKRHGIEVLKEYNKKQHWNRLMAKSKPNSRDFQATI